MSIKKELSKRTQSALLLIFVVTQLSTLTTYGQRNKIKKILIPENKIGLNQSSLKLNGFYYTKHTDIKALRDTIKYIEPLILFKNGVVINYDYIGNGVGPYKRIVNGKICSLSSEGKKSFNKITSYFACFLPALKRKDVYTVYAVYNRIIKIQRRYKRYLREESGIVLNDSTFVINKVIDYTNKEMKDVEKVYFFKRAIKPDSSKHKLKKFYK